VIRVMNIAHGNQGTLETLRIMVGLTIEAVNDLPFRNAVNKYFNLRTAGEIDAKIRNWYVYTPEEVETLYSPMFNMERFIMGADIIGDCDDIAMFLAAVLRVRQYPVRFVAMRTKRNDPEFYHVVVEALENKKWKRFDPTVIPGLVQVDYGRMVEYV
jgi:hypothetical protein